MKTILALLFLTQSTFALTIFDGWPDVRSSVKKQVISGNSYFYGDKWNTGYVDYTVNIKKPGNYLLQAKVITDRVNIRNSFRVEIDNNQPYTWYSHANHNQTFANIKDFYFTAGVHRVRFNVTRINTKISDIRLIQKLPKFPVRNIDTRTIQYQNGKLQTTAPHIPVFEMSLDGRVGLLKRAAGSSIPFLVMKPEKVQHFVSHAANPKGGANLVNQSAINRSYSMQSFSTRFPRKLGNYTPKRSILCEKTERVKNPYACNNGNSDCYRITVVTRFHHNNHATSNNIRYASEDVIIRVDNPKTVNARIANISPLNGSAKIGRAFLVPKFAEPTIAGDGRLLVGRVHKKDLRLTASSGNRLVRDANMVYSVYPMSEAQCDVTKWNKLIPLSHAPYDTTNQMAARYKFARYPFRDTLGNTIPNGGVIGASYPWIDKDAANLFFTSFGVDDPYYHYIDSIVKGVFEEPSGGAYYLRPSSRADRNNFEAINARTAGVAMMGLWTHGKMILLDGQINNADYNFRISNRNLTSPKDMTRKLRLYQDTPSNQSYEKLGMVREKGDEVITSDYDSLLATNSSFLGSIENRYNYLSSMKPVTARDVVWHFGTSRHTQEIAFDDYINPRFLINATMTGAVGYINAPRLRHFDGVYRGRQSNNNVAGFPDVPSGTPLLLQNAVSSLPDYFTAPKYGKPIGPVRLEPIAKGGIYGKGLWLEGNAGLAFKVPAQSGTFRMRYHRNWYVGVFLDPRGYRKQKFNSVHTQYRRDLVSLSNGRSIKLSNSFGSSSPAHIAFNTVELWNGTTHLASLRLTSLALTYNKWKHLGIQFWGDSGPVPAVYINGLYIGNLSPVAGKSRTDLNHFFNPSQGTTITLGSSDAEKWYGVKAWYDDFKVLAWSPGYEERCNHARGTVVRLSGSGSPSALDYANKFPTVAHNLIKNKTNSPNNSKFICHINYGKYYMRNFTKINYKAHLKNLPRNSTSVRERITHFRGGSLRYNRPRPNYSNNHFCKSCHIPQGRNTFAEMDSRALTSNSTLSQFDSRRQPSQPPQRILGVIPANYFGTNRPRSKQVIRQTDDKSYIDYWILPR